MNPTVVAVAATLVALVLALIAATACWALLEARRIVREHRDTNLQLRCRLDTYRCWAGEHLDLAVDLDTQD